MTCKQLGGACELKFQAETFEEMAAMSKKHGQEMFLAGDGPHLLAMNKMQEMMGKPGAMEEWYGQRKREFDELAEDW